MLKAIKVVDEIPSRKRGNAAPIVTTEMADEFAKVLMMNNGKWVQYFDEPCGKTAQDNDRIRAKANHLIKCAAMGPYKKRIENTTRTIDGNIVAFARWI